MTRFGPWAGKVLALWAALAAATALTGFIPLQPAPPETVDGPLGPLTAMLIINAFAALAMAGLAAGLIVSGWRRFAVLFVVLFSVETGLSWIEAVFFNDFVKMSAAALVGMAVSGLIKAAIGAGAAALLWRRPADAEPRAPVGYVRPILLTGLYVVLYFAAGATVAWSSAAVRAYYGDGLDIDIAKLALLQLARGAIWTGLAAMLAVTMRGRTLVVAGLVGAAFGVLMAAPLLYPSAVIPWPVRQVHLVELMLVNFVFGALAIITLRRRVR